MVITTFMGFTSLVSSIFFWCFACNFICKVLKDLFVENMRSLCSKIYCSSIKLVSEIVCELHSVASSPETVQTSKDFSKCQC